MNIGKIENVGTNCMCESLSKKQISEPDKAKR